VIRLAFKEIGVLWRKEGKKGSYLTGTLIIGLLGKVNIAIFPFPSTRVRFLFATLSFPLSRAKPREAQPKDNQLFLDLIHSTL